MQYSPVIESGRTKVYNTARECRAPVQKDNKSGRTTLPDDTRLMELCRPTGLDRFLGSLFTALPCRVI